MRKLKIFAAVLFGFFPAMLATMAMSYTADDFVTRTSVAVGSDQSFYQSALHVRASGVDYIYEVGDHGLTRTILFNADYSEAWATAVHGTKIRAVAAGGGGGGFVDSNGNGTMDPGEEGAGGGGW